MGAVIIRQGWGQFETANAAWILAYALLWLGRKSEGSRIFPLVSMASGSIVLFSIAMVLIILAEFYEFSALIPLAYLMNGLAYLALILHLMRD